MGGPIDRNEQARRQFQAVQEQRRLLQAFAADVAAGKAGIIDRFAQAVTAGSLVIWRPPHDMVFHVAEMTPVLDPRQPPGLMELTLTCRVPVTFAANQPVMSMIKIGTQQAPGHASLDEIQPQEPPQSAPDTPAATEEPSEIVDDGPIEPSSTN